MKLNKMTVSVLSLLLLLCISSFSRAATTTYSTLAAWQVATPGFRTILFDKNDAGIPFDQLQPPPLYFPSLLLQGYEFRDFYSYYNQAIVNYPGATIRVVMAPGTTSFGSVISPFYDVPENYVITVSIGGVQQVYSWPRQNSFFGVASSDQIDYVEFRHDVGYITLFSSYYWQGIIPFAAFSDSLTVRTSSVSPLSQFTFDATVTLGAGAKSFDPMANDVGLVLASLRITIPAGSFVADKKGGFTYGSKTLSAAIAPLSTPSTYSISIRGSDFPASDIANPVPIRLSIGANSGANATNASFYRTGPAR